MVATRKHRGYIRRVAYTRKLKNGKRVRVPAAWIKNVGRAGKGYRGPNGSPGIGPLREGELSQFGYTNVVKKSARTRRIALKKAVAKYGSLSVRRKLQAVATYTKRTSPGASKVFKTDIAWIKRTL
jgi:Family of unknown function (DUF5771)